MTRFSLPAVFLLIGFSLLLAFLWKVQIIKHEYYTDKAKEICRRNERVRPARGTIFDINGNILAIDYATQNVFAEPKRFKDKIPQVAGIISRYMDLDYSTLLLRFNKAANYRFSVEVSPSSSYEFCLKSGVVGMPGMGFVPVAGEGGAPDGKANNYRVLFCPENCTEGQRKEVMAIICEKFGWEKKRLEEKVKQQMDRCQEIPIRWQASMDDASRMQAELRSLGVRGVRMMESWDRNYPRDSQLANVLGFLDVDRKGVSGIEALMDEYLQPVIGWSRYLRDKRGRPAEGSEEVLVEPRNGANVYLTVIEPLQAIAEKELMAMVEKNHPRHAYIIMLDPASGAIMALAQYPQFNPNDRSTLLEPGACENHCILQSYEPGSMMKPVSMSGLVENNVAGMDTEVYCEKGRWRYAGRILRDGNHRYEDLTLAEVLIKSSNIGTAKLALQWGDEPMYHHMEKFGFGRRTGVGFYPEDGKDVAFRLESRGIFRPLHEWKTDKLKITRVPIGQGISCTPMQMVQAWSAFANDGIIMQPYIVERVVYPDGRELRSLPRIKARPFSAETCRAMRPALKRVATPDGTARRAAVSGYEVAGKTGTAQIWVNGDPKNGIKGHYSEKEYLASFIGYAPADDPRFLLLVSAEAPTSPEHTGSNVAAPVWSRVAAQTLEYLQIPQK